MAFEFTLGDPDFYTPLARTVDSDDPATRYAPTTLPDSWQRTDLGIWTRWDPAEHLFAEQGWKVHVAARPDQLRTLLSYSPYHNVVKGRRYPPTLLVAGDADSRVDPLHSRTLTAMLQDCDPLGGPVLFRSLADVGHGDGDTEQALRTAATTLAFLARHTGLDGGGPVSGPSS